MFLITLLGMLTIQITLLINTYHLVSHTNKRKKIFYDLRHYFWDDPHIYKEGVDSILDVVYLGMNRNKSYGNVTLKLIEDITRETEPLIRYCNLVFTSLLSSRMPVSLFYLVMNVIELVISVSVKKCLQIMH